MELQIAIRAGDDTRKMPLRYRCSDGDRVKVGRNPRALEVHHELESGGETPEPVISHQSLPAQLHKKKYAFGRHVSIFAGSGVGGRNLFGVPAAAAGPPSSPRPEAAGDGPPIEPKNSGRSRSKGRHKRQSSKKSRRVVDGNSGDAVADDWPPGLPVALQTCKDSDSSCSSPSRLGTPLTDRRPDGSHSPGRQELKRNRRTLQEQGEMTGLSSGYTSGASMDGWKSVSPVLVPNPPAVPDTHTQLSAALDDGDPHCDEDEPAQNASDAEIAAELLQHADAESQRPLGAASAIRDGEELRERRRSCGQAEKGRLAVAMPRRACSTDTCAVMDALLHDRSPVPRHGLIPVSANPETDGIPLATHVCTEPWRNQDLAAASGPYGGAYNRDGVFGKQMIQAVPGNVADTSVVANAHGTPAVSFSVESYKDPALPRGIPAGGETANLNGFKCGPAGEEAEFLMWARRAYQSSLLLRGAQRSALLPPLFGIRLMQEDPVSLATTAEPQYTMCGGWRQWDAAWRPPDSHRAPQRALPSGPCGVSRAETQAYASQQDLPGAVGPSNAVTHLQASSLIAGLALHHAVPGQSPRGVATGKPTRGRPPLSQRRPGVPAFSPALWSALLQRTSDVVSASSRACPVGSARPDDLETRRSMVGCMSGTAQPLSGRPGFHRQVHEAALDSRSAARTARGEESGSVLVSPQASSSSHALKGHAGWGYDRPACNGGDSLTNVPLAACSPQDIHGESCPTFTSRQEQAGPTCSARAKQSLSAREHRSRHNCKPGWTSERLQTSPPRTHPHGQGRLKPLQLLNQPRLDEVWAGKPGVDCPLTVGGSLCCAASAVR